MKADIIKIGNSQGIRIPKAILEQCNLKGEVKLEVDAGNLIVKPARKPREGWDASFKEMAENGDDVTDWPDHSLTEWDDEEWEW